MNDNAPSADPRPERRLAPSPVRPPAPPPDGGVPPYRYRVHIERELGLKVIEEPGWPTERKRYFLVRPTAETEKHLATYTGTLPEALAHFYRILHPQPKPPPITVPAARPARGRLPRAA